MYEITIYHYLFLGLFLFVTGITGSILSKHVIKVLISIELMLTGVNINFITFARYCDSNELNGYVFTIFYLAIGAVELAVALYLFYLMYQKKHSENIEKYGDL